MPETISLIMPVLNERGNIEQALDRAFATNVSEVIVVDGGSTDQTPEMVRRTRAKLLISHPGRGTQLNCGLAEATGDILVFLHADNWLPPDFPSQIREMQQQLRNPRRSDPHCFWGGFCQRIEHDGWRFRWLEQGNRWRIILRGLVYGDQAMFISRPLLNQLGGFSDIPLMEDYEISLRLKRFCPPWLLPGPVFVSPRRWLTHGVIRQTIQNWSLTIRYQLGVSPEKLASSYTGAGKSRRSKNLPPKM